MSVRGPLAHVDITVSDLENSCRFYDSVLTHLGFRRLSSEAGNRTWVYTYEGGRPTFEIALQPARGSRRGIGHDRYAPGLHHLAFHADGRDLVDRTHEFLKSINAHILDPPAEYSGKEYTPGYYAIFFADPDGIKLELCYVPAANC